MIAPRIPPCFTCAVREAVTATLLSDRRGEDPTPSVFDLEQRALDIVTALRRFDRSPTDRAAERRAIVAGHMLAVLFDELIAMSGEGEPCEGGH